MFCYSIMFILNLYKAAVLFNVRKKIPPQKCANKIITIEHEIFYAALLLKNQT